MTSSVWYPSVEEIIDTNIIVLDLGGDKHPHKILGSKEGIKSIIQRMKDEESKGVTYQAAKLMKDLVSLHAFDGGNHRTAYIVAKTFLRRNGKRFRVGDLKTAYPFIKNLGTTTIEEVQKWIEHGTPNDS